MNFYEYDLIGNCSVDLNTEIRFEIASARYCNADLIKLTHSDGIDDRDTSRINTCISKILRALCREKVIQFFVSSRETNSKSTEVDFLINKFADLIDFNDKALVYYIKT